MAPGRITVLHPLHPSDTLAQLTGITPAKIHRGHPTRSHQPRPPLVGAFALAECGPVPYIARRKRLMPLPRSGPEIACAVAV